MKLQKIYLHLTAAVLAVLLWCLRTLTFLSTYSWPVCMSIVLDISTYFSLLAMVI